MAFLDPLLRCRSLLAALAAAGLPRGLAMPQRRGSEPVVIDHRA